MRDKRGLTEETLMITIIILVMIVILVVIAKRVADQADEATAQALCRQSVSLHVSGKYAKQNVYENINCPTEYATIEGKKPNIIFQKLANEHYLDLCRNFLFGKEELFNYDDEIICVIGSVVEFEESGKLEGFPEYLNTHGDTDSNRNFYDICSGHASPRAKEVLDEYSETVPNAMDFGTLDMDKKYAFVMIQAIGTDKIRELTNWLDAHAEGLVAGSIIMGGGVLAGVGVAFVVSNPVGWAVGVSAVVVGGVVIGMDHLVDQYFGARPEREFISLFLIREYDSEALKEIGCRELPAKQNFRLEDLN